MDRGAVFARRFHPRGRQLGKSYAAASSRAKQNPRWLRITPISRGLIENLLSGPSAGPSALETFLHHFGGQMLGCGWRKVPPNRMHGKFHAVL